MKIPVRERTGLNLDTTCLKDIRIYYQNGYLIQQYYFIIIIVYTACYSLWFYKCNFFNNLFYKPPILENQILSHNVIDQELRF